MKKVLALILSLSSLYSLTAKAKSSTVACGATQAVTNQQADGEKPNSHAINWNALSPEKQLRFMQLDSTLTKYGQVAFRLDHLHKTAKHVKCFLKHKLQTMKAESGVFARDAILDAERNQAIAEGKQTLLDAVTFLFSYSMTKTMFNGIAQLDHNDKDQFIAEVRPFIKSQNFNPEKSLLRKIIEHKEINEAVVAQECNQYMTGDGKKLYTSVRAAADEFEALVAYINAVRTAVKTGATQPSLTKK